MEQSIESRKRMSAKLKTQFPNHVPVFVRPLPTSKNAPMIRKKQFIIATDLAASLLLIKIRQHITLNAEQGLFFLLDVSKTEWNESKKQLIMLDSVQTMGTIANQALKEDGFIYLYYDTENAFGHSIK